MVAVNKRLLPIKLFYLFYYGGISCVVPYIPNYLKQVKGFSPVDVTVVLASARFLAIFTKPLVGHIADKTRNYQITTLICLFIGGSVTCLLTMIPTVPNLVNANSNSTIQYENHFENFQFWLLFSCFLISNSFGLSTSYTLVDALTLKILFSLQKLKEYGRQRMWMTPGIAFALITVSGFMDFFENANFLPAFLGFVICIAASALSVSFIITESNDENLAPKHGITKVFPVFLTPKTVLFISMAFVCGLNFGMSTWLMPFYLQVDLQSTKTTVGLAVIVFCFTATVAFYFSGFIISKFGHELTVSFVLIIYALRAVAWSFVRNPWCSLFTEILMGLPFGLWLPTMGSYARKIAPYGSEASAQAVMSAIFDGFGVGLGNLSAGWLYQTYGGCNTWLIFSLGTFTTTLLYMVILLINKTTFHLSKICSHKNQRNLMEEELKALQKETSMV